MRPSTPAAPGSLFARFGAALIAEKLRILRTLRGLDRAGVDPTELAAIREPLVRLAEVDQMLTSVLEVFERDGVEAPKAGDEASGAPIPKLLQIAEASRGDVADRLPPRLRRAFDKATGEVAALEAEVWMQVDDHRAHADGKAGRRTKARTAKAGPLTDAEARRAGDKAWGSVRKPPLPEGHARVAEAERMPLPSNDAPLVAWFERMPAPWLQGIALVEDVAAAGAEPLAVRVAALLSDAAALERILAEKLGASEREKLAILLEVGLLPLGAPTSHASEVFAVAWDWTLGLPAHVGAKLRAHGIVHVGTWAGARVAAIPPPLRGPLRALLASVDPDAADGPRNVAGNLRATAVQGAPFPDAELARWKAVDKALCDVFESWIPRGGMGDSAVSLFFGPGPRELEGDAQRQAFFEYLLFDWRARPDAPTLAERAFQKTRFASPDHRALAEVTMATRPAIYRIERVDPGVDVEAVAVFPPGPSVRVTDRGFSHTARKGIWVPLRVYPAGPFHFVRIAGDPILRAQQPALERALLRGAKGADPAAWIAENPAAFFRILRANSR